MVLDGYNVLKAMQELKKLTETDFSAARDRLIEMMAEYGTYRGIEVLIVFDAHMAPGAREHQETIKGVNVVFTREKMTADSYIEKLIHEYGRLRKVLVVTNDWTEQLMVLGSGAVRVTVRELALDLRQARHTIRETTGAGTGHKEFLSNRIDEQTRKKLERIRRSEDR